MLKIDGSLARNIDFEVANFEVLRKTRRKTSILKLQSVKIEGRLARNARFEAPTCLVSILWISSAVAVSLGEAAKALLFEGFQAGCNVVASMVLPDVLTCPQTCRQSFCVTGAILLRPFQAMSSIFPWQRQRFRDLHRHFARQAQHLRRVVSRCMLFGNSIVRAASSGDTPHSRL